jgi:hypothetical protein
VSAIALQSTTATIAEMAEKTGASAHSLCYLALVAGGSETEGDRLTLLQSHRCAARRWMSADAERQRPDE